MTKLKDFKMNKKKKHIIKREEIHIQTPFFIIIEVIHQSVSLYTLMQ